MIHLNKYALIITLFIGSLMPTFANIASEKDIRELARGLQKRGNGQFECYADHRTLVLEFYLMDNTYLENFEKNKIINNIEDDLAVLCATNFIDVKYVIHYTNNYGNEAVKNFRIKSSEFLNLRGDSKEIYSTKDSPKGLGVNMTISKPKGWEAVDGDGPHVVQKFEVKKNGNFTCYLIQMNAMPTFISKSESKEIMSGNPEYGIDWNNYIEDVFPAQTKEAKVISISDDVIGTFPAKRIEYSYKISKKGHTISVYGVSWMIFYEDALIFLNGCTTSDNEKESLMFSTLFDLITNSVHFYDIYTDTEYGK